MNSFDCDKYWITDEGVEEIRKRKARLNKIDDKNKQLLKDFLYTSRRNKMYRKVFNKFINE